MSIMPSLFRALAETRRSRARWEPAYDAMVAGLRASGAGSTVPRVGQQLPVFSLPDADGRWTQVPDLLRQGRLVLSWQRGGWCPYCRTEMAACRNALPELAAAGGRLVVITPETGGRAAALRDTLGHDAVILCDVDHGAAMLLGLTVPLPADLKQQYLDSGLDLDRLTGGAGGFVPIPATFATDQAGRILFAHADVDFRLRAEPADVIAAIRAG